MKATIEVDTVLDLLRKHQQELAKAVDAEVPGYKSHTVLWTEYKRVSQLYDDIRKAAE